MTGVSRCNVIVLMLLIALAGQLVALLRAGPSASGDGASDTQQPRLSSLVRFRRTEVTSATSKRIPFKQLFQKVRSCGQWQEDYKRLHAEILQGKHGKPRVAVATGMEQGLADRMSGAISVFYFALLTRRAFQISTYGELPGFELAFDRPNIDWLRPPDIESEEVLAPVKFFFNGQRDHPLDGRAWAPELDTTGYSWIYLANQDAVADDFYVNKNFSTMPEGNGGPHADVILVGSNRGRTVRMFENPHHEPQLRAWGLTPTTAFQCAFQFLFAPVPEIEDMFALELDTLLGNAAALKIGINIRVGDLGEYYGGEIRVFDADFYNIHDAIAYFDCAQQIEASRAQPGQHVIWYLISDSLALRKAAMPHYGHKLLTNIHMRNIHPNCYWFKECLGDDEKKALAMRGAAGQLLVFSLTDVQVVTKESGFGRQASWLSSESPTMYQVSGPFAQQGEFRNCSIAAKDDLVEAATYYAGLR